MENDSRFVQLEIPGMEQFLVQNKTVSEITKMTPQAITNISAKSPDNQITFYQLEIPGMEEFIAKLKTQSESNNSIDYSRMSKDFAA
ncbi:MAG: hypothetical protein RMY64_27830 [Nostoc sp. DedQUE08]|uniref:hypothetical protein n=1 Tax=unclassified Nostoc TaxID=2593658 RepID=UPI002AD4AF6C|nr:MULTISPECIES: hypothetical protein [unclassified Nostoc]MDZ8033560.1 hypothetical protein [Nostoc sp. DedSLP04]MDZ8069379.1 hypothetical protein [Nostoc sp. DedQUE08]MDZ8094545.1 hypothetical protein [Nostoc sp. DedQUE05]